MLGLITLAGSVEAAAAGTSIGIAVSDLTCTLTHLLKNFFFYDTSA